MSPLQSELGGREERLAAPGLPALTALLYEDGPRFALLSQRLVRVLRDAGLACAGFIQHDEAREGRSRCDMMLENIETGARVCISDERGSEARGCRLDSGALVTAVEDLARTLSPHVDLLLLTKFGKSEAEGSGFRPLIAQALEAGIPIILGVPMRNVLEWRRFAEDLAQEIAAEDLIEADDQTVLLRLGLRSLRHEP